MPWIYTIKARGRALREEKRRVLEVLYPALKKRPVSVPAPPVPAPVKRWGERIVLGRDSNNLVFSLDDDSRFLHTHIIGVPGSGKSTHIMHGARQDVQNGACVIKFDPHANDPNSLYDKMRSGSPPRALPMAASSIWSTPAALTPAASIRSFARLAPTPP